MMSLRSKIKLLKLKYKKYKKYKKHYLRPKNIITENTCLKDLFNLNKKLIYRSYIHERNNYNLNFVRFHSF